MKTAFHRLLCNFLYVLLTRADNQSYISVGGLMFGYRDEKLVNDANINRKLEIRSRFLITL